MDRLVMVGRKFNSLWPSSQRPKWLDALLVTLLLVHALIELLISLLEGG